MDYLIREMKYEEYGLLSDFLYEVIYIPKGVSRLLDQWYLFRNCRSISLILEHENTTML